MNLLRNLNFSLLISGRLITNIGDSLYFIAATWLAYDLGGSAFYSGLAGFLTLLPEIFTFLIGPIVDRSNLKKLLVITSFIQFIFILLVPVLYIFNLLTVTLVLIIMPFVSIMNMFTYPAESALIPTIVKREDIVKANSTMAFVYQGTELIFNGLGGILIAMIGAVSLYFIDSLTFLTAMILFASMRLPQRVSQPQVKQTIAKSINTYKKDLTQGIKYVLNPLMLNMMLPLVIVNFTFSAATVVFPAFADEYGGASTYGILMACTVAGMLIGSLISQFISKRFTIGKAMIIAYSLSGFMWIFTATSASTSIYLTFIFLALSGIPIGATNVIYSSLFQIIPPENMIARVASVSGSLITAAMPLGALIGGYFATVVGSGVILASNGVTILILSIYWLFNKRLRNLPKVKKLEDREFITHLMNNDKLHF